MSRVVVSGSRHWVDELTIRSWLAKLPRGTRIAHGACRGADEIAGLVARDIGLKVVEYPVDESVDGPWPAAGPLRNRRMLRTERPSRVLAFALLRGGKMGAGTADCMLQALAMGTPVTVVPVGGRP